jgi:hypothetical protein
VMAVAGTMFENKVPFSNMPRGGKRPGSSRMTGVPNKIRSPGT